MGVGSARARITVYAREGRLGKVDTDRFIRSVVMVAGSKWVRLVQLIDTIEFVASGKATDEGFHSCFAGNVGRGWFEDLPRCGLGADRFGYGEGGGGWF